MKMYKYKKNQTQLRWSRAPWLYVRTPARLYGDKYNFSPLQIASVFRNYNVVIISPHQLLYLRKILESSLFSLTFFACKFLLGFILSIITN